jgi:hypothetical protein
MDPHVEAELLAFLDGELDERERARVETHLAACSRCAAELEQLRLLQGELDATLDTALGPVRLPAAADHRIRDHLRARLETRARGRLWWGLWQRRGLATQVLLAVLVLTFAINTQQLVSLEPGPAPPETLVLGYDRMAPGSQAGLRVLVRSTEETIGKGEPIEGAEIVVRIGRTPGLASIVYTGQTDASGSAEVAFQVPEDLAGEASLIIETSSAAGTDRIVRPIFIARDYGLFLSSDKPVYRPGQTIHVRALALAAIDHRPASGQDVHFAVLDPNGQPLAQRAVPCSDFGIAGFDLSLALDAAHGQYILQAQMGDTVSERTVEVGAYELPTFRVTVETGRTFYSPGEHVTGLAQAAYFYGKPVAGGRVTLRATTGAPKRIQVIEVPGETDDEGRFEFGFDLPIADELLTAGETGQLELEIEVIDTAGQQEGIRHVVPVAQQPILIRAVPESGLLKPNIENKIFVLTSYPDGQPAETTLSIVVEDTEHTLATGPYGLAEFRYTPGDRSARLDIRAQDGRGAEGSATFSLDAEQAPATLILRTERAVYEVGDTLRAETLAGGMGEATPQAVYLDVVRAGQTIATLSAPITDGRATFALDLDGTMMGTLELHAYSILSDGSTVQDTRLAIVDAPRQVAVAVSTDRADPATYRPGDTAHLQIQTSIGSAGSSQGGPVQSALGIGVVDESVTAVETQPPGFAQAYFLLEREALKRRAQVPGLDLVSLVGTEAEETIEAAQDVAARAALAGAQAPSFTLSAQSVAEPKADKAAQAALSRLSNRLIFLLILLPLALSTIVARGLWPSRVLGRALHRVAVGGLVLLFVSPLVALVVGGGMWLFWAILGVGAPVTILLIVIAALVGLAIHGWRQRDARLQLMTGLLAAYLALGGMLVMLAAQGGDPGGLLLALIAVTFLLTVVAVATLGQGLVLEGWSRAGWATTLMGLLLIPLVVYLPFVPGLASDLTHTLGNPALYAGPVGWMTGCAYAPMPKEPAEMEPAPTEMPAEPAEEAEVAPPATPSPVPSPTAAPAPTGTPVPAVREPFPLRQVFPETLYWNAEAVTDENGHLALDLPLADNITTWRLTALASTREGELGVSTYDIVVFQDFFLDLDLPATIKQGEEISATVTLYNYLDQDQTVLIELVPDQWYDLVSSPQVRLTLPPNDVATADFVIQPAEAGRFSLQVTAEGERVSDGIAREVTVEP